MSKARLLQVLVACFIFIVTLELASTAYFHFANEGLALTRKNFQEFNFSVLNKPLTAHPLFTYVSTAKEANNFGFKSKYNFPYQRQKNEFVVGVFGGSVADEMALKVESLNVDSLFKDKIPALRGKKLIFLNFAAGCGKQPMQFQRFSHFAKDIDFALSIDGFNEIIFNEQGAEVSAPCRMASTYGKTKPSGLLSLLDRTVVGLPKHSLYNYSSSLVLVGLFLHKFQVELLKKYNQERISTARKPETKLYPYGQNDKRDLYVLGAKNWAHYSKLQLAVGQELGIPMLAIIQPNRLFKNSKPFSEEETDHDKIIISNGIQWVRHTEAVTRGYNELRGQLAELKKTSPKNYLDLSLMFKDHPETLYRDSCCHLNDKGYELMWAAIVKNLKIK